MSLNEGKKEKSIAFQAEVQSVVEGDLEDDEDLTNSIASLTKKLNKLMKNLNRKEKTTKSSKFNNPLKNQVGGPVTDSKKKLNKGIQCHGCEGFGHIQAECANTFKKKGKSFNTTWSDDDSEGSQEGEDKHVSNYTLFNIKYDLLTDEEMQNCSPEEISTVRCFNI